MQNFIFQWNSISSVVKRKQLEKFHVEPKDLDGIVSTLRSTAGVEAAVFVYPNENDTYKVSLRSASYMDVAQIAMEFGGGGHSRAAGVSMEGKPDEILKKVLAKMKKQLKDKDTRGRWMYNGIINVYKEKGYTSFDVVARMRGICGQKKIGHTGTLDPDAEGVLPVCLGKATKVCDMLTDSDKVYRAVMQLGIETDTQDLTGTVLSACEVPVLTRPKSDVIRTFQGEIMQVPPMYSALKVNGKKLCDLARAGVTVERKARPVTIYEIRIERVELPEIELTVSCSKGTYIRTLVS